MREIKFRAWSKLLNKMLSHEDLNKTLKDLTKIEYIAGIFLPMNSDVEVMQYTGLKDKNGKEIYEGDILSYKHITYTDCSKIEIEEIEDESFIEMINYTPIASIVKPHSKNVKCFGYDSINKECLILDLTNNDVEVIGNKFENPELLG